MKPVRVLFVGWDGAEPALVEPWVAQGKLPVLAGLLRRGALGRVASTIPATTPPAWSSLVTGLQPGRHGIYSFTRPGRSSYAEELVTAAERQGATIWHYLSAAGVSVGVFNLSLSYPPEPVSGFLFAGFDAPVFNPSLAYPAAAFGVATRNILKYVHEGLDRDGGHEEGQAELLRQLRQQRDMVFNLTAEYPVEVLAVNFNAADHIHHYAWPVGVNAAGVAATDGPILRTYQELDAVLGDLLTAYADDATQVMLVSDHGGGQTVGQVSLARAFEAGGFLVRSGRRRGGALLTIRRGLRKLLPHALKVRLWGLGGVNFRLDMARRVRGAMAGDVDWSRTKIFPWGSSGFAQINQRGRESQGSVAPEDAPRVLADVAAYLQTLTDPRTGVPAVGDVLTRAAAYGENAAGYAPDLLVQGAGNDYSVMPWWQCQGASVVNLEDPDAQRIPVTSHHHPDGILATAGPAVRAGATVPALGMADLAPALLYLAGVPVPAGLDGQLARSLWDTGSAPEGQEASAAVAPEATPYSEDEQAAVERRLTDLGYM
jgi:predicted AlkP superfamily phosphohydrolase/phosphomutase